MNIAPISLRRSLLTCLAGTILIMIATSSIISAQNALDFQTLEAQEEFSWGVRAFHRKLYSEAILSFSRSLAIQPDNLLVRVWLGKAQFAAGFTDAALSTWQYAQDNGENSEDLAYLIGALTAQQESETAPEAEPRYRVTSELLGKSTIDLTEINYIFSRPTNIALRHDGDFYLASYATGHILRFDVNGVIRQRIRGRQSGLARPFDVLTLPNDDIAVSEFANDTITILDEAGNIRTSFGSSGVDEGNLLGPQYLTIDDARYLYVTDWGNQRIAKFDLEGNFVLSFGTFESPTGIAYHDNTIYVIDAGRDALYRYDTSGNLLETFETLGLNDPESLIVYDEANLLIVDTDRLLIFNTTYATITPLVEEITGNLLDAALDANGTIIASDVNNNRVLFLNNVSSLYSGLVVHIHHIDTEQFPRVQLEVAVTDRSGTPIIGLRERNFLIFEGINQAVSHRLIFADHNIEETDIAVLIDKSPSMEQHRDDIRTGMTQLLEYAEDTIVVAASDNPILAADWNTGTIRTIEEASANRNFSPRWDFAAGVRVAANKLIASNDKRGLIFFTYGELPDHTFAYESIRDLTNYLATNHIQFHTIYMRPDFRNPELDFISEQTRGSTRYLYDTEGIASIIETLQRKHFGRYRLSYTSEQNSDFGRAYIPTSVEAYLIQRSGREESGYFAPLEF